MPHLSSDSTLFPYTTLFRSSARKLWSENATLSSSAALERSDAKERPYSYYGWDFGAGVDTFWPQWTAMLGVRSEEHTSELQSRLHIVCRLLLEKKKGYVRIV